MRDTFGGIAVLAVLALLVVVPIGLSLHRRPPEAVVTKGSAGGRAGMTIHPGRGHPAVVPLAWLVAAGVTALGFWYLGSSSPYAAVTFIVAGLYLLYLMWARTTGRAGDGALTLTPEGLHQLYAGSEVFVPWDVVRGLVTTPTDFIVETTKPVIPVQRCWTFRRRRSVVTADAISLPRQNLPPLPYQQMVELYSTTPTARDELATQEPIQRARGILTTEHP